MDNGMTYLERWKECHKEDERATAANIIENASNIDNTFKYLKECTILRKNNKETTNTKEDIVNHPQHYISKGGIETIDVIDAWTEGLSGIVAVDTANVIKYISRWNRKNGVEDLKKARWYLDHLIMFMEKNDE